MIEKIIFGLIAVGLILCCAFVAAMLFKHFDYKVARRLYVQAHDAYNQYKKAKDEDTKLDLRAKIGGIVAVFCNKTHFIQLLNEEEQKEIEEMIPAFFPTLLVE